ncbi:MAG: glutamate--tRNA ligase family protein, partial [Steroidobacteraceae bacterium]|nr:glutamate--tRNA ligase family protein [Steroidobacteraceae bacterium]
LGSDGTKLSKRHGAVSVLAYEEQGYLPEALLNYLVRLGWSHGDQEIFSLEEMIAHFDIDRVGKSAAAFNPEKLLWLNQQHLQRAAPERLAALLRHYLHRLGIETGDDARLEAIARVQRERSKTLLEMAQNSRFFFVDAVTIDPAAAAKHLDTAGREVLADLAQRLAVLAEWRASAIHALLAELASARGVGLGKVAQPLRVAVSGGTVSPPIDQTLEILGRDRTLARIGQAVAMGSP